MSTKPFDVLKEGGVAKFQPFLFDKMIQGVAPWFQWSRSLLCSCRLNPTTDQPDPTCGTCGGNGFRYVHPRLYDEPASSVDFMRVQAVFANASLSPNIFHEFGEFVHGDAMLTAPGGIDVGWRDRWVGVELRMPYSQILIRAAAAEIPVGFVGRTTSAQQEALRYAPVEINFIGDVATTWRPGVDFVIKDPLEGEKATVQWLPGKGPVTGDLFSIHYTCRPVWVVDSATYAIQNLHGPRDVMKSPETVQRLPTTFKIRLDHMTEQ